MKSNNPFEYRKSGAKKRDKIVSSKHTSSRLSRRDFKGYVERMLGEEWMLPEDIPTPAGYRKRNVLRMCGKINAEK